MGNGGRHAGAPTMPGHSHTLLSLFRPPDLEHIPERRYQQLIQRALLRRGDAAWMIPLAVGLFGAVVWIAAGYGIAYALTRGGAAPNWARIGLVNVIIAAILTFAVGSVVRWRMVTGSIRRLLNRAACPFCEFSLIGLEVHMGGVVCPECGERLTLNELGLTKDDLAAESLSMLPFDGAGRLGSFAGQLPEQKKIRADKAGHVRAKPRQPTQPGGDVML